ncbi:MAG: type VI secretion IcmF C-terminal domain-containing protein, partial [Pseudomonadota bacterium]
SRHFAPLRAILEEVDGEGPYVEDIEMVFTQLLNEVIDIAAQVDRNRSVLTQGELPNIARRLLIVARDVPDPIDRWLIEFAEDVDTVNQEAVVAELDSFWRANYRDTCIASVDGRFPFERQSPRDISQPEFTLLFGPGQLFDEFRTSFLDRHIDTSVSPWRWNSNFTLDPALLQPFEQAVEIQRAMFPGGGPLRLSFDVTPDDLSGNAGSSTLRIGSAVIPFNNSAPQTTSITWPDPAGPDAVSFSINLLSGVAIAPRPETSPWAVLRVLRPRGAAPGQIVPPRFNVRLANGGGFVDYVVSVQTIGTNPFDLTVFEGFSCPDGFQ